MHITQSYNYIRRQVTGKPARSKLKSFDIRLRRIKPCLCEYFNIVNCILSVKTYN